MLSRPRKREEGGEKQWMREVEKYSAGEENFDSQNG
jgi:hypothetical protein